MKKILLVLFAAMIVGISVPAAANERTAYLGHGNKVVIYNRPCVNKTMVEIIDAYRRFGFRDFPDGEFQAGVTIWEGKTLNNCWINVETGIFIVDEWDDKGSIESDKFTLKL